MKKTHKFTIEFDSKDAAEHFLAHWIDGGGDGGGHLDFYTKNRSSNGMRVSGTGMHWVLDPDSDARELSTPEFEQLYFEMQKAEYEVNRNPEAVKTMDRIVKLLIEDLDKRNGKT